MSRAEKFTVWCDKAMAFSIYALIYFLPISIALSEAFTGFTLFFWLLKRGAGFCQNVKNNSLGWTSLSCFKKALVFLRFFRPVENYLNKPILILLFFSLISVFVSRYPMLSVEGFLGKVLQSAFLYFNFIECINSKKRLRKFLIVFLVSATLISINGLYQHFTGKDFIYGHLVSNGRISSSFRAHNDFAAYLVVVVPIFLSLSVLNAVNGIKRLSGGYSGKYISPQFFSGKWRVSIFVVFLLSLVCLGLTFSRGAWIAFAFVMAIFSTQKKRYIVISGLILILFFSFFYPQLKETRRVGLMVDSVLVKDDMEQAPDILETYREMLKIIGAFDGSGRSRYWMEAIHMIRDYPVFGVGLNTYSVVGRGYKINWGGYPHNCYLQMAVETGIVGLLSFLWLLGVLFYKSFRSLRFMKDRSLAILLLGSLIGLGGFLVHSFFDTNFYSVQLGSFMWLVMGLIVTIQKIDKASEGTEGNHN